MKTTIKQVVSWGFGVLQVINKHAPRRHSPSLKLTDKYWETVPIPHVLIFENKNVPGCKYVILWNYEPCMNEYVWSLWGFNGAFGIKSGQVKIIDCI